MKININLFIIAILLFNLLPAQNISLFNQLNGHLDYTAIGNTLNKSENNGSSNCIINTNSSATLNLSPTQTVEAAYLYWAGSGSGDFNVTLNTTDITPSRTFAYNTSPRREFFAAFADVTTLIQTEGNGLYTLSDLEQNVSTYCSPSTNFAGWAITIIYSDPALPFNQVNVYDGLETVPRSITIQLDNLNVIDTTGAKVGFIAWEGDAGLAVNEVLQMNGVTLSNRPLNPANNAFNGTNSFTNDSNLYNMDIDVYSIENAINAGDTSAVIQLTSGQDLVMVNNIITVLNSQLPDASVAIDSVDQRCNPRELTIEYTVRNLNSMRLLPANTPIAFYIDTVLVAQTQTSNDIPGGGTESNTLTFTANPLLLDPINLTIVVDDNGSGTGIISEISETNNSAVISIVADPLPIANQPPDLEDCDDNFDGELKFDISPQTALILGSQNPSNFTVSYFENMGDAESGNNPLELTPIVVYTKSVVAKIVNNTTRCANYTSFNLIVNPLPIVAQTHTITQCDTDYDGLTIFNIKDFEINIFDVQQNFLVATYFDSLQDLENGVAEIQNVTAFQTISNPQIIYIKVLNTTSQCYTSAPLTLTSILPPAINPISEFEICDSDTNSFDLSEINSLLTTETQDITLHYFDSLTNAENKIDPITVLNYQSNTTPLFVRIQDTVTNCFHIHSFNFIANPLPIANQPPDLEDCDDNFDGELKVDMSTQTALIIGSQNPSNFTVSYYENRTDAESGNNPLELTPIVVYTKSVVAKIVNNTTRCANYTSFNLIVNPLPIVDIPKQLICLDNLPHYVSAETFNNGDTYLWSTGQTTNKISIDTTGTYSVTVTTPKGCVTSSSFEANVSGAAMIEFTEVLNFTDPNSITVMVKGVGDYQYKLDDNPLQTSNFFNYVTLGYHTITVVDLNGCSEVTKEVLVINAQKFFTPNNDTYFDTWNIIGIDTLPGSVIYIFDRYGKLLGTLAYNSGGWDGTYRGYEMPANDYWFFAKIKTPTEQFEYKGHFALRR